jgi:hypothetical protein
MQSSSNNGHKTLTRSSPAALIETTSAPEETPSALEVTPMARANLTVPAPAATTRRLLAPAVRARPSVPALAATTRRLLAPAARARLLAPATSNTPLATPMALATSSMAPATLLAPAQTHTAPATVTRSLLLALIAARRSHMARRTLIDPPAAKATRTARVTAARRMVRLEISLRA